ncbi:hypothetical protein QMP26_41840 (plasmid) [Enterocloster clostridioformis]
MSKVMPGYIRKVDTSNNQILDLYPYPELLLNVRGRSRLKEELDVFPSHRLFCACSSENNRPVFINSSNSLYFPENIGHAPSCVAYIKEFSRYLNLPLIKLLLSPNPCVPVTSNWSPRSRSTHTMVTDSRLSFVSSASDRITLEDFVKFINYTVFYRKAMDIFHGRQTTYPEFTALMEEILFEFGKCSLRNTEILTLGANTCFQKHQPIGTISFLYAKITAVNRSYKSNVYITAQYINGSATFELEHEKWNRLEPCIDEDLPMYICAIIRTEESHSYAYGKRDPVTHTFQGKVSKKRERYHILSTVLFHANSFGLICCTKEEYRKTNNLCSQGKVCFTSYFPEIPTS